MATAPGRSSSCARRRACGRPRAASATTWVALLKRGDRVGARFEFITALELQQGGKLPATNLLGLLYLQGDREDAQRLIERLQLDARDIRAAEARARSWGAVPTPGAAPASDDPLAELPAEANMHTAMANEAP